MQMMNPTDRLQTRAACDAPHTTQYPCAYGSEITDNQQQLFCAMFDILHKRSAAISVSYIKTEHKQCSSAYSRFAAC